MIDLPLCPIFRFLILYKFFIELSELNLSSPTRFNVAPIDTIILYMIF